MLIHTEIEMKRLLSPVFTALLLISLIPAQPKAQIAYSPFLDSLIQLSDFNTIDTQIRELTGHLPVVVDGVPTTIQSRYYQHEDNAKAAKFIRDKFIEYGYTPEIQTFNNGRGENVIATKTGTKYPDKEYIISCHYDNMPSGPRAPGADDNGSGTVAVLEAARVLSPFEFDYTIRFIAFDEEEIGLVGSYVYAQRAKQQERTILGVLNLDMIAWDSDNDFEYSIATNNISQAFTNDFIRTTAYYQPQLNHNFYYTTASDHASFWQFGYPAILAIEDWYDFNEYYHTPADDVDKLNMPYFIAFVRASIANIAAQGWDHRFHFTHEPVISGNSTEDREAVLVVSGSHPVNTTAYPARLYYSANGSGFDFVNPYRTSGDSLFFIIPGFAFGTEVNYYFAVQDELSRLTATYPSGGSGINPPGTQAPETFFSYQIDNIFQVNNCSPATPLALSDPGNTYDIIYITTNGTVEDVNVAMNITHTRTGDLRLILTGPTGTSVVLSNRIGGNGQNYTNTVFDDDAELKITEGQPPYTGSFRPEMALEAFNGSRVSGDWQLRINDATSGNSGTLDNWCLHILYRDHNTGVNGNLTAEGGALRQNYPNPAKETTTIEFSLDRPSYAELTIFNAMQQLVAQPARGHFDAGNHLVVTSLKHLAPGRYFYRLTTDHFTRTLPLIIVR